MSVARVINSVSFSNQFTLNSVITGFGDPTVISADFAENVSIPGNGASNIFSFNGNGSPQFMAKWSGLITLVSGALSLDLTNLTDRFLGTVTMATLKLQAWQLYGTPTNANPITAQVGASNGYTGLNGRLTVGPGDYGTIGPIQTVNGVAVDSSHKTIDFSGTGAQTCQLVMLFG